MPSVGESALPSVFDGIYQAALEPERWREALTAGASALGVTGLSLMAEFGVRAPSVGPPAFDEIAADYIAEGWYQRNDRFLAYLYALEAGKGSGRFHLMSNHVVFPDDPQMERLAIQQEFFRRHRTGAFVGARLSHEGAGRIFLSVDRLKHEGDFSHDELGLVGLLAGHIDRALQISVALEDQAAASGIRSLEAVGKAAIGVGRGLAVVAINARAEAMLGAGIEIRAGRLATTDPSRQRAFERLVARASGEIEAGREPPGAIALPRPQGRPLVARAAPYLSASAEVLRGMRAIVLLTDLDSVPPTPSETLLRDVFGLTRAEARLAAGLGTGATLEDCATNYGVSLHTVRNQLAAVFAKMGVRRQTDLVLLAGQLAEDPG